MATRATQDDLAKAHIEILTGSRARTTIPVEFNPKEYRVEKSVTYSDQSMLGLGSPITQFASGNATTLSMELLFDTYEEGGDVTKKYTEPLESLLEIDGDLHAPPVCLFVWGTFEFQFVLARASKTVTMFRRDGTPVRAKVDVTLKRYREPGEETRERPRASADKTEVVTVEPGDTLWGIADEAYGDPAEWVTVAAANEIDNPRRVEPGRELTLPPLEG